jgi:predicted Zn finger-like uncharacterized protein
MLGTSICPNCDATFNINEAQLDAALGMVRCGRCLEVFDFRISYIANQPDPQLELLISNEQADEPISDEHPIEHIISPEDDERISAALASARNREIFGDSDSTESHDDDLAEKIKHVLSDDAHDIKTLAPNEFDDLEILLPIEEHELDLAHTNQLEDIELAGTEEFSEDNDEFSDNPRRIWPWVIASALFLIVLLAQATYFFRVELAANYPATKSILNSTCVVLKCTVPLPQNASLMSIESSGLEDAPLNHLILNALLRNHATFSQAYPNLEFTLTDTQDNPQARRIFKPADYLSSAENETTGLLPNHEVNIKLHLDTMDIKPSGYRLVLFYQK